MYKVTVKDKNGKILSTETFTSEDFKCFKTVKLLNYEDYFRFFVCDTFGTVRKITDVMSNYIPEKDYNTVRSLAEDIVKLTSYVYNEGDLHIVEANYGEVIAFGINDVLNHIDKFEVVTSPIYDKLKFEIEKINN